MTFDIGLHEVCVPAGGRASVLYVITKSSLVDSLPNFLTHGAPLLTNTLTELTLSDPVLFSVALICKFGEYERLRKAS